MRQVSINEIHEEMEFAEKAAKSFAQNKQYATYSIGDLVPGCFLALRWGLGDDCVLVVKLSDEHIPTNYAQLINKQADEALQKTEAAKMTDKDREETRDVHDLAYRICQMVWRCHFPNGVFSRLDPSVDIAEAEISRIRADAVKSERERCAEKAIDWIKCNQGPDGYLIGFPDSLRAAILADDKGPTK